MRTIGRSSKADFASYDSPPSEMKELCNNATLTFPAAAGVARCDDRSFGRATCGGSVAIVDVSRMGGLFRVRLLLYHTLDCTVCTPTWTHFLLASQRVPYDGDTKPITVFYAESVQNTWSVQASTTATTQGWTLCRHTVYDSRCFHFATDSQHSSFKFS